MSCLLISLKHYCDFSSKPPFIHWDLSPSVKTCVISSAEVSILTNLGTVYSDTNGWSSCQVTICPCWETIWQQRNVQLATKMQLSFKGQGREFLYKSILDMSQKFSGSKEYSDYVLCDYEHFLFLNFSNNKLDTSDDAQKCELSDDLSRTSWGKRV